MPPAEAVPLEASNASRRDKGAMVDQGTEIDFGRNAVGVVELEEPTHLARLDLFRIGFSDLETVGPKPRHHLVERCPVLHLPSIEGHVISAGYQDDPVMIVVDAQKHFA